MSSTNKYVHLPLEQMVRNWFPTSTFGVEQKRIPAKRTILADSYMLDEDANKSNIDRHYLNVPSRLFMMAMFSIILYYASLLIK